MSDSLGGSLANVFLDNHLRVVLPDAEDQTFLVGYIEPVHELGALSWFCTSIPISVYTDYGSVLSRNFKKIIKLKILKRRMWQSNMCCKPVTHNLQMQYKYNIQLSLTWKSKFF